VSSNIEILTLKQWFPTGDFPLIISGPCSAESREQLLSTAKEIAKIPQVKVLRAGIWKPRTRPGEFEGVGVEGLKWLFDAKRATGLMTCVEVAEPAHVELALENGVDILWLGARTVVNPFSVQSIAEALKGTHIPVMIKNPVSPDLKLWIGAIERVYNAGITKIMAIHRGFHYFQKSPFRNAPMWEIPIELKRAIPNIPIIVDPSHICGRRSLLQEISQKALDLEMDGLMIESHINPSVAKTDAAQQLSPADLKTLLSKLIIRDQQGDQEFQSKLEELRTEIDKLDGELLEILSKRMEIINEIGDYKIENDITILQMKRWAGIIEDRLSIGTHLGLDKDFLLNLLKLIHTESIKKQETRFKEQGN
jgi:chorismate mutase